MQSGAKLTYTLHLTNTGSVSLTATLTDYLPSHVTPTGVLTWMPPALLPNQVWSETVVVSVEAGYTGLLTNVVQVVAGEGITGSDTAVVFAEQAIAGLSAANDSPTELGSPTALTATITAGSNVTYTWAFGDGEFGSGAVVSHTYPAVGVYTAVVTASNSVSSLTATTSVTITDVPVAGLSAANDSPTARAAPRP